MQEGIHQACDELPNPKRKRSSFLLSSEDAYDLLSQSPPRRAAKNRQQADVNTNVTSVTPLIHMPRHPRQVHKVVPPQKVVSK